ncbi:glycosyltransferase [Erythrobacter arachoides]|uniref:Glycosyltransferase n=1 Tax=Aurantiacibacter arachoides TaxID=1850444 RepID=A0A845A091_9SPHN|nr:glycosyltransferase [Aurantiacibacter arachoides]MXO93378.1 glycosyltransferase [Aurantiacibacter arachoides]GGD49859.1 glycosyl transferase family 1 [Aurantiacibacter arachoides]
MTRSLHVVASLDVAAGGPSYSVPRLCKALAHEGDAPELATVGFGETTGIFPSQAFAHDYSSVPVASQLRLSRGLERHLRARAGEVDIVHNHGLWLAPNFYAGHAARAGGAKLVVSARGMVSAAALRFSARKKRLVWQIAQGPAVRHAAGWHATSEEEVKDIRSFGVRDCPVAVVPNGVDLPATLSAHDPDKRIRTALFLSRVHPKKGLPNLVTAWARLAQTETDWRLVIAGPDEGAHTAELQRQAASLGVERIVFAGPVFGAARDALFAEADLYVLPTQNENFGIAVAEALAAGVPAIVTKGAPWQGLDDNACGWWIDHGVDPLVAAMEQAMAVTPAQRQAMGLRGREWVEAAFSWQSCAQDMAAFYRWLTGGGTRPPFVHL